MIHREVFVADATGVVTHERRLSGFALFSQDFHFSSRVHVVSVLAEESDLHVL